MLDLEKELARELRELAEGLTIPPRPALPTPAERPARAPRRFLGPLLVAAAVLLIVGIVAVITSGRGGDLQPAPAPTVTESVPSTSATERPAPGPIPTNAPSIPHVVDGRLWVRGVDLGEFWTVYPGAEAYVALKKDGTWMWGRGTSVQEIEGAIQEAPVISPNGKYVAHFSLRGEKVVVTGFDTSPDGEGFGQATFGRDARVRAVTDFGGVIVQGGGESVMWVPREDRTVDLPKAIHIIGSSPGGLISREDEGEIYDGQTGEVYLTSVDNTGVVTRGREPLPNFDDISVNSSGTWSLSTPAGSTGGEVEQINALEVGPIGGDGTSAMAAPDGWDFVVRHYQWEDDDYVVATVRKIGGSAERMARCQPSSLECVLIAAP
ncbi:MAG: hypothetical protein V9G04_18715 [Nocardioides sp.]|jgi:hypothetical protein